MKDSMRESNREHVWGGLKRTTRESVTRTPKEGLTEALLTGQTETLSEGNKVSNKVS